MFTIFFDPQNNFQTDNINISSHSKHKILFSICCISIIQTLISLEDKITLIYIYDRAILKDFFYFWVFLSSFFETSMSGTSLRWKTGWELNIKRTIHSESSNSLRDPVSFSNISLSNYYNVWLTNNFEMITKHYNNSSVKSQSIQFIPLKTHIYI